MKSEIGRYDVTGGKLHDISRDKIFGFDAKQSTVLTDYTTCWRCHGAERLNGLLCAIVLEESNDYVQNNDGSDDTALDEITGTVRKGHCDSQNEGKTVGHLSKENFVPGHTS